MFLKKSIVQETNFLDHKYRVSHHGGRFHYIGDQGSYIWYDEEHSAWIARNKNHPDFKAKSESEPSSMLLGTHLWQFEKDHKGCKISKANLTLSTCSQTEFTCNDGSCLDMKYRCNGRQECEDGSDEVDCTILLPNIGYDKMIIPVGNYDHKFVLKISIVIRDVTYVDEIDKVFRVRFDFVKKWNDHNMKYQNLLNTSDKQLNHLSEEEMKTIWMPYVVFFNTESKDRIRKSDKKDVLKILPNEDFIHTFADKVQ